MERQRSLITPITREVLGIQVPEVISDRIFYTFASTVSVHGNQSTNISNQAQIGQSANSMSFEDLVMCFIVFTKPLPEEDDLIHYCKRIAQLDENFVNLFYKRTKLDPRIQIFKDEFVEVFGLVKDLSLFSDILEIVEGFKKEYLNVIANPEKAMFQMMSKSMALSEIFISDLQAKQEQEMDLKPEEMESIKDFFDEEIRGQQSANVIKVYKKLLQGMKNKKFLDCLILKISQFKGNNFEFFQQLACIQVKQTSKKQKIQFLFTIFSDWSNFISPQQFTEMCYLFDKEYVTEKNLSKDEFVDLVTKIEKINPEVLCESKLMFIAILGIKNLGSLEEEQSAIQVFLEQQSSNEQLWDFQTQAFDLEAYILKNISQEETFFIIEKEFWDDWKNVETDKFKPKKLQRTMIDNKKLIQKGHEYRLRDDICYNVDFVIAPKYVFKSLNLWYDCNQVIERCVHKSKIFDKIMRRNRNMGSDSRSSSQNKQDFFGNQKQQTFQNFKNMQGTITDDTAFLQQNGGEASCNISQIRPMSHKSQHIDSKIIDGHRLNTGISSIVQQRTQKQSILKVIQDVQYELEFYPRLVYFQKVDQDGVKPHKECILNYEIDQGYMKKYIKSDQIPFYELSITKKGTLELMLKHFSQIFEEPNYKKGRLLIDDQIVSGIKLTQTLEEYGIQAGQLIYVEFLLTNNSWPTDNLKNKLKEDKKIKEDDDLYYNSDMKTVGLYNLGNTCYMNSAIQCLVNIKMIHEYYVKDKTYLKQLNLENRLGHQGDLVLAFSNLIQSMWNGSQVVVPKGFKTIMGKIKEQFKGDEQQDSNEYLNFLVDGLHEETNLRKFKPYIENPESENRDLIELGLESWSNNLQRDWSFIFFMFYGQMKSTLHCMNCKKESTTFDVFTNIPVSLPESLQLHLYVIVYRLPRKIKALLEDPRFQNAERGEDSANKSYTYLTNDQPIQICLKVDKNILIKDLIKQITSIPEVNIQFTFYQQQPFQDLVVFQKSFGAVRGIFDPNNKLTQYKLVTNEIHAHEILTPIGKRFIKAKYAQEPSQLTKNNQFLEGLVQDEICEDMNPQKACEKFKELVYYDKMPGQIICVAYHRRFVYKNNRPFKQCQPQLLSSPIILSLPSKPTGYRIYEEIWSIAHNILQKNSQFFQKQDSCWWKQKDWKQILGDGKIKQLLSPFVLKMVDRQGFSCSECNWIQKCSGCIIEPDQKVIPDFLKKCHIAIEWNSEMIEKEYNPTSNEIMRHNSINQFQDDLEDQIVSLEKCLQKFHDVEKLSDKTYCSQCKDHTDHQKSFEIFRPPPVLTIQLKRFRQIQPNKWRKQQTLVEFPFYNLDICNFVQDYQFLAGQDISCQYDLCGIINHYGSLSYGHYTSVVKNPFDNQWYRYDDQHRNQILEKQIQKDNAYILFYVRKDINYKHINEIFPSIDELFPGKPVKTKFGQGFILGKKPPDKVQMPQIDKAMSQNFYYVKIKQDIYEINESHILPDKDRNEININKRVLDEINKQQEQEKVDIQKNEDEKETSGLKLISTILFCSQKQKSQNQVSIQQSQQASQKEENEMTHKKDLSISSTTNKNNQVVNFPQIESNQFQIKDNLQEIKEVPVISADIDGPIENINESPTKSNKKKKKKKKKITLKINDDINPEDFF